MMMKDDGESRCLETLQRARAALPAIFGAVGTLLVIAAAGDLRDFYAELPAGWTALWLVTTLAVIPTGIFLIVARRLRFLPLKERRDTAMAYLVAGFINLLSFSIYVQVTSYDPSFFCVPLAAALALLILYALLYVRADRKREETFP
jgi:hydrogenase-4 membrane subunit HyfE